MGREYKIRCTPLKDKQLSTVLRMLPSPILRPQMCEIYNFRIDKDGYYLIDHLVDRATAAIALQVFLDAALSTEQTVTVEEL